MPALLEGDELLATTAGGDMDPRLQRLTHRRRRGLLQLATASESPDEAAVLAKITDVKAWERLSEVRVGARLGPPAEDGTTLVTARIPVTRIEQVRRQPFVRSLKAAQRLRPSLDQTIVETGARADLLPAGRLANGGDGAVVGIVDFGLDFAHQNFRNADGTTRIAAIWDQSQRGGAGSPFGFGREFTRDQINAALATPDPYAALGYEPTPDAQLPNPGTHGTHVADIAAGNGRGSGVPGMAPQAEIVFVDVAVTDLPGRGPGVVGSSFGDSARLLEALRYIFDKAGTRPCVINVSLGTNGGPHDGTTLVEQGIDRMVREASNRAVVIAASNSFDDGIHAAGQVVQGGQFDLAWEIDSGDFTHNELEIWYSGPDRLAVELIAPGGNSLGTVNPGANGALTQGNRTLIFVANRLGDPNNQDNMIGVFLEPDLPTGTWGIRLHGVLAPNGRFHAWIERDDLAPSRFAAAQQDSSHTIGSISCGQETIVVGSYDAHKVETPLSFFSSAGPTRDGREKPEVSAPGHAVLAAHSRTGTGVVRKSGTSMAAPAVTGLTALVLAEARARSRDLSSAEVRNLLIQAARKNPPDGPGWDPRYGHGRVSASAAVAAVMALAGTGPALLPVRSRSRAAGRR